MRQSCVPFSLCFVLFVRVKVKDAVACLCQRELTVMFVAVGRRFVDC